MKFCTNKYISAELTNFTYNFPITSKLGYYMKTLYVCLKIYGTHLNTLVSSLLILLPALFYGRTGTHICIIPFGQEHLKSINCIRLLKIFKNQVTSLSNFFYKLAINLWRIYKGKFGVQRLFQYNQNRLYWHIIKFLTYEFLTIIRMSLINSQYHNLGLKDFSNLSLR